MRCVGESYLNNPIVVLLTEGVTNCVKKQISKTSVERDLYK